MSRTIRVIKPPAKIGTVTPHEVAAAVKALIAQQVKKPGTVTRTVSAPLLRSDAE